MRSTKPRENPVEQQPQAAGEADDNFVAVVFHFLHDAASDFFGRLAFWLGPREAFVFKQLVEVFAFGGARGDE